MPQAIEWSLATPMTRPRLPCIRPMAPTPPRSSGRTLSAIKLSSLRMSMTAPPKAFEQGGRAAAHYRFRPDPSGVETLQHNGGVGTAEPERVRQYVTEAGIVDPLADDRHIGEGPVELLDVRALADEAVVHHQERVDRLLDPGRAERMAGERFRRRNRGTFVARAEHLADRLDLLLIADRRRGGMRIDVVDAALHVLERLAHAAHGPLAGGRDHVVAVRGRAVAGDLAIDAGAAGPRVVELLQHHDTGAAGNHEAVAVHVIGAGRGLGPVVV